MSLQTSIPPEIVYEILTYQFRDYMSNDHPCTSEKFNENLRNFLQSNLTVNKTFYHICRVLIYRYCNFTTAKRFNNLLNSISHHPQLGNIIQIADFQELTSIGLGRSTEMNKMIQNLTNVTLLKFLQITKSNLKEFLACEHIQDDLDDKIIYFLLKPGKVLSILDFCGCSGLNFTRSFILALERLYPGRRNESTRLQPATDSSINDENQQIASEPLEYNNQITCIGLNDCTDLPSFVLVKLLKLLPEIQKLDLSHTSIDDNGLISGVPHLKNLSHLSLANCSQLTPRAVLEFFSHHPAVTDPNNAATLEWLNLSNSQTSSLSETHVMFLLKKLCQFGHNKTLQYLNIGNLPLHHAVVENQTNRSNSSSVLSLSASISDSSILSTVVKTNDYYQCADTLMFIKLNFPNLKSLSIRGNNVPISKLVEFLQPIDTKYFENLKGLKKQQALKFLNISNNSYINKWTIQDQSLLTCSSSLTSLEISFDAWQQVEKQNANNELVIMKYNNQTNKNDIHKWKCFIDSSYGRRYWIYKTDKYLNKDLENNNASNATRFDSNGNKIIEIVKQPDFLKFAQSKIALSCGLVTRSSYRRKNSYRDSRPPISQFLTRNGGIAFGNRSRPIIRPRLPPGGWRILTDDEHEEERDDSELTPLNLPERPLLRHNATAATSDESLGPALYWDRSIHDLTALRNIPQPEQINSIQGQGEAEEEAQNDEEYLNNPELQRRRSQLSLLRPYNRRSSSSRVPTLNNLSSTHSLLTQSTSSISLIPEHEHRSTHTHTKSSNQHGRRRKPKDYYYKHPEKFVYDPNDAVMTKRYQLHFELVNEYKVFGCVERGMYRYYSLKM